MPTSASVRKRSWKRPAADARAEGAAEVRRTCRNLTAEAVKGLEAQGRPYVLRFKSLGRKIAFRDAIHGEMAFPADHVDDFIIMRPDGVASYNFAAAVDDLSWASPT